MAFYTLQLASNEQAPMLRNILTGITSAECDLIIIAHDGRKIYSHKKFLFLFSKTLSIWISSLTYNLFCGPYGPRLSFFMGYGLYKVVQWFLYSI